MIGERRPQVGDIIVQDRRPGDGDPPDPSHPPIGIHDVRQFTEIPSFPALRPITHGDIIVDVQPGFVETIGGNLGDGVRRRRYPLTAQGLLVIDWNQLYVQESPALVMPALPAPHAGNQLVSSATWRIFALLSPVHECVTLPGIPSLTTGDSVLA